MQEIAESLQHAEPLYLLRVYFAFVYEFTCNIWLPAAGDSAVS